MKIEVILFLVFTAVIVWSTARHMIQLLYAARQKSAISQKKLLVGTGATIGVSVCIVAGISAAVLF